MPAESVPDESPLRRCRDELAEAHRTIEILSTFHAEHAADEDRLALVARHLDEHLTKTEYAPSGWRGTVKRRLIPATPTPTELADARELRSSQFFDGAWYLATYPEVAGTGLSPALHYLRHGAAEGKDPGPEFNTRAYLLRHPLVARRKGNPLLNHLRTHQ